MLHQAVPAQELQALVRWPRLLADGAHFSPISESDLGSAPVQLSFFLGSKSELGLVGGGRGGHNKNLSSWAAGWVSRQWGKLAGGAITGHSPEAGKANQRVSSPPASLTVGLRAWFPNAVLFVPGVMIRPELEKSSLFFNISDRKSWSSHVNKLDRYLQGGLKLDLCLVDT